MNTLQPTSHLFKHGAKLFDSNNIGLYDDDINKSLVTLRYNKAEGVKDLHNRNISVCDTSIIQYLDSLIDLDDRISFVQFCISPLAEND